MYFSQLWGLGNPRAWHHYLVEAFMLHSSMWKLKMNE
jgi:hypothetical protein